MKAITLKLKFKRAGDPKTHIVVTVVWLVPVAVSRAEVLWIIVPGTAANNTTREPFRSRGYGIDMCRPGRSIIIRFGGLQQADSVATRAAPWTPLR